MNQPPDRRPAWQREGREPDYRFSLANERTFLAWIRTALALLAGAVLFDQLAIRPPGHAYVGVLSIVASGISALLAAVAYWRWKGNEIAMRHDWPLPGSKSLGALAVLLFAAGVVTAVILSGLV